MKDFERAKALFLEGLSSLEQARYDEAESRLRESLRYLPDRPSTMVNLSSALLRQNKYQEAADWAKRVLAVDSGDQDAWLNLGVVHSFEQRASEALMCFERVLALNPAHASAHNNRGNALQQLGRLGEALAAYERAIALHCDYAEARRNRGDVLLKLRLPHQALASIEQALALAPDDAGSHLSCGNALMDLKRPGRALQHYRQAHALHPENAVAAMNIGYALSGLGQVQEAIPWYLQALALKPDYATASMNLGTACRQIGQLMQALAHYERALAADPELPELLGHVTFLKLQLCDWSDFDLLCARNLNALAEGRLLSMPLLTLALTSSPKQQRQSAEILAASKFQGDAGMPLPTASAGHGKIRIGYFSADFRYHPVGLLMAGILEAHDRTRFEVFGFAFAEGGADEVRQRIRDAVDVFLDVSGMDDREVAELARRQELDIAIDLGGYTDNSRTQIFALRAAPIQISYLGYAGTLGAEFMDYLVADRVVIPESMREHYREHIVHLPHSYFPSNRLDAPSHRRFTRAEAGLPEGGMVYCGFNSSFKLNPALFDCWMAILAQVPGSVLWLSAMAAEARDNLSREAQSRGVSGERLVFAERMPLRADHLARLRLADLFLDTFPYNAHTTASDALWAGLPVLTCPGDAFASRVGASLLQAVGMPELIACSAAEYQTRAVRMGMEKGPLALLRERLARLRQECPLFDTRQYVEHLEAAYRAVRERHQAGLLPDHLHVPGPASY